MTPTQSTAEQLEVTQADRDLLDVIWKHSLNWGSREDMEQEIVRFRQSTEARMAAAVEWQDIAIAPRDGTTFLAFQPGKSGACVVRARTDAMRVDFYRQPQADVCWQELPEARYSHWMPLPPPPAIRSATDGQE